MNMCRTAELDMFDTALPEDVEDFLADASYAICFTYHTVLKSSPGAAIFRWDMLFDIPYISGWTKIGKQRQQQTHLNSPRKNKR